MYNKIMGECHMIQFYTLTKVIVILVALTILHDSILYLNKSYSYFSCFDYSTFTFYLLLIRSRFMFQCLLTFFFFSLNNLILQYI